MKRILILTCAALSLISLTACAQKRENKMKENKILVTYFSATGTTRRAAERLAETFSADLHEIKPAKAYSSADLDWRNDKSRSSVEMNNRSFRPALADGQKIDLSAYDVVFIGFPIWWDVAPTVVNTFIEANDFKGKIVIPFATSGSSSIRNSSADMKRTYSSFDWREGKLLNGASKADIEAWKKQLGL